MLSKMQGLNSIGGIPGSEAYLRDPGDALHRLTTVPQRFRMAGIEGMYVLGMIKSCCPARSIPDVVGWVRISAPLRCKGRLRGRQLAWTASTPAAKSAQPAVTP